MFLHQLGPWDHKSGLRTSRSLLVLQMYVESTGYMGGRLVDSNLHRWQDLFLLAEGPRSSCSRGATPRRPNGTAHVCRPHLGCGLRFAVRTQRAHRAGVHPTLPWRRRTADGWCQPGNPKQSVGDAGAADVASGAGVCWRNANPMATRRGLQG